MFIYVLLFCRWSLCLVGRKFINKICIDKEKKNYEYFGRGLSVFKLMKRNYRYGVLNDFKYWNMVYWKVFCYV